MSPSEVSVFWDYASCPLPSTTNAGYAAVNNIRAISQRFGSVKSFRMYIKSSGQQSRIPRTTLSELQCSGVSLIDCPEIDGYSMGTGMMLVDMMAHAVDNSASSTLVLISGDRVLAYALSTLRLRCYRVVVIAPEAAHLSVLAHASMSFHWGVDVLQPPIITSTADIPANGTTTTRDRGQLGGPPATCDCFHQSMDPSNFKFPQPPTQTAPPDSGSDHSHSDSQQLRARTSRATLKPRNRSESFASPLLSRELPPPSQAPTSSQVPPTRTFATRAVSTETIPIPPSKLYESRAISPVNIPDALPPLFGPEVTLPAVQEMVQMSILPTPPCISEEVPQDSEPLQKVQETDLVGDGKDSKECWGLQDLQRFVQRRAESLKESPLADESVLGERAPNPSLLSQQPSPLSDSSGTAPHYPRPPSLASIKASDSFNSTSPVTEKLPSLVQSPSSTPPISVSQPTQTTSKKINSTVPEAARVAPGLPLTVPPAFKPLFKALHHMRRSRDSTRPLQRAVAGAMNSTKETYQAAGVDRFPRYIAVAKEQGLVSVGGSEGKEWVSLKPEWLLVPYE